MEEEEAWKEEERGKNWEEEEEDEGDKNGMKMWRGGELRQ